MERRQVVGNLDPGITISTGIFSGPTLTLSTESAGSSHPIPAAPSSSWPSDERPTTAPTSLAGISGSQSPFSDVAAAFFSNKGAMAGVFAGLGILLISLCAIIYIGWIRKRRRNTRASRSRDAKDVKGTKAFDAFSEYKPRLNISSERPRASSVPYTPSVSSNHISLANLAEWWERRRGQTQRSSQFRGGLFAHSRPTSMDEDDDVREIGEEDTQWTLGKVLEDHRHQIILPLPPVPSMPARGSRFSHVERAARDIGMPRGRNLDGEGEGEEGRCTLEDALLPSLSSSPIAYELASTRIGRHPYAQP